VLQPFLRAFIGIGIGALPGIGAGIGPGIGLRGIGMRFFPYPIPFS